MNNIRETQALNERAALREAEKEYRRRCKEQHPANCIESSIILHKTAADYHVRAYDLAQVVGKG